MDYKMNVRQRIGTPYHTGAYGSVQTGVRPAERPAVNTDDKHAYPSLAMVYAPSERFEGLYAPEKALLHGTLFEKLDLPFRQGGC